MTLRCISLTVRQIRILFSCNLEYSLCTHDFAGTVRYSVYEKEHHLFPCHVHFMGFVLSRIHITRALASALVIRYAHE